MSDIATVNDHLVELESELERLSNSVDEIHAAREAASKVVSASQSVLATLGKVSVDYQKLYKSNEAINHIIHDAVDSISEVDFPSRLDKLDNTVSAVSIGVQNLATSFHDLSQEFEGIENRLTSLRHGLMVQRGIMFALAVLLVGGFTATLFLR
jgi:archaellum component FlaC